MRRSLVVAVAVLILAVAVALVGCSGQQGSPGGGGYGTGSSGSGSSGSSSGGGQITMENFSFSPDSVTIKVGESVTWTNNDSTPHTVTGDNGLDSGDIAAGSTYSKKFDTAGTYSYHCSIHPSMTGKIIVK